MRQAETLTNQINPRTERLGGMFSTLLKSCRKVVISRSEMPRDHVTWALKEEPLVRSILFVATSRG